MRLDSDIYKRYYVNTLPQYSPDSTYQLGQAVRYNSMRYIAQGLVNVNEKPSDYMPDGNPWKVEYWFEDGDQVIIEPLRWYIDGDSWIANIGNLGIRNSIVQSDLEKVKVVPNPYYVDSIFNDTPGSGLMWFTHLPNKCKISIYTISGQLVYTFNHNDEFSGQASWNLKTGNGDMIAPGLYLYTVQAGGPGDDLYKHIGKFYVVR